MYLVTFMLLRTGTVSLINLIPLQTKIGQFFGRPNIMQTSLQNKKRSKTSSKRKSNIAFYIILVFQLKASKNFLAAKLPMNMLACNVLLMVS